MDDTRNDGHGASQFDEGIIIGSNDAAGRQESPSSHTSGPPATPSDVDHVPPTADARGPESVPAGQAPSQPTSGRNISIGTLVKVGLVALLLFVGWFSSRGETQADRLAVGDCFAAPAPGEEFDSVDDQPCNEAHESQIFAEVSAPSVDEAFDECLESLIALDADASLWPEDVDLGVLSEEGETTYQCTIESISAGLTQSIVPESP